MSGGVGPGARRGLVVSHYGLDVEVRLESGDSERIRVGTGSRSGGMGEGAAFVVGDEVIVDRGAARQLPRRNVLERRDARGRTRVLAANLDVLGITVAAEPPAPADFVDRTWVAARAGGIAPCVVVNKCDREDSATLAERLDAIYGAPRGAAGGVRVFRVSATRGGGLDALRRLLAEAGRAAFVGTSGVGKSSLLNALIPGLDLRVGTINRFTRLGRHVTTRASLHALPGGGEVIDTPGVRDFVPARVSPHELSHHFAGFEPALASGCRFRDCLHRDEPGCSVRDALEAGALDAERHRVYLSLLADLERAAAGDAGRRRQA